MALAGQRTVGTSFIIFLQAIAFSFPVATTNNFFALKIVPIPMVIAALGTSLELWKNLELILVLTSQDGLV